MINIASFFMIAGQLVIISLSLVVGFNSDNAMAAAGILGFGSLFWMILVNAAEDLINWPLVIETYHRRKRLYSRFRLDRRNGLSGRPDRAGAIR